MDRVQRVSGGSDHADHRSRRYLIRYFYDNRGRMHRRCLCIDRRCDYERTSCEGSVPGILKRVPYDCKYHVRSCIRAGSRLNLSESTAPTDGRKYASRRVRQWNGHFPSYFGILVLPWFLHGRNSSYDHPDPGVTISWDIRSLKDFGDYPVTELAKKYDFIMMDHPHIGSVLEAGALVPLEMYLSEEFLKDQEENSVGRMFWYNAGRSSFCAWNYKKSSCVCRGDSVK